MAREHVGPILNLRDAVKAQRLLWVFCRWCGHAERLDPRDLAYKLGRNLTFEALAEHARCRRCTHRGRAIVLVSEHQFLGRND